MDNLDNIRYRMRVTKLEARLALREIECAALTREINSPLTSTTRKTEAAESRESMQAEGAEIMQELTELRLTGTI